MNCEYHCESGWLPTDGVVDEGGVGDGCDSIPILWPTEYAACVCNPFHSMNPEMEATLR